MFRLNEVLYCVLLYWYTRMQRYDTYLINFKVAAWPTKCVKYMTIYRNCTASDTLLSMCEKKAALQNLVVLFISWTRLAVVSNVINSPARPEKIIRNDGLKKLLKVHSFLISPQRLIYQLKHQKLAKYYIMRLHFIQKICVNASCQQTSIEGKNNLCDSINFDWFLHDQLRFNSTLLEPSEKLPKILKVHWRCYDAKAARHLWTP